MRNLTQRLLPVLVLLAATAFAPCFAQDTNFKIFGAAAYVSPLEDEEIDFEGVTDSVQAAEDFGWDLGFEWRAKWIGIEADYLFAEQDIEFGDETIGTVDFGLISATVNFHLIPTKYVDFYLGPTVSWTNWGDLELDDPDEDDINIDDDPAFGVSVGLDLALAKHLSIVTGLRYLDLDAGTDEGDIGVNPLIARLGLGVRW